MYNDSGGKAVKFILVLIVIVLAIFLFNKNKGKKIQFRMMETVKIGNVELCFDDIRVVEKLKPAKATDDYGYFESVNPNQTILDISGTVKNTTSNKLVLKDEFVSNMIIEKAKYKGIKKYENKDEDDFLEENSAVLNPSETLKIHYLLIADKTVLKKDNVVEVLIEEDGKTYSMKTVIK